jgi:hypothetical protein
MNINNKDGIYRVIAGDPKEENENKIFLKENMAFEEADKIFNSLLEKKSFPVILLDGGDITIRRFRAPDTDERDQWYTVLKEGLYQRTNPDHKPYYVVMAWEDANQNISDSEIKKMTYKLSESEDFGDAFASYVLYAEHFNDYGSHFDGVKIIDSKSNRLIDSMEITHNNTEKSREPKRKKKEDPGYER